MALIDELLRYVEVNAVTVTLGLIVCVLLFWPRILEKYRYPPGPIPLPFIGNDYYRFSDNRSRSRYDRWRKAYGNVVSYVSLGRWTVELYGYEAIREAFVTNANHFSERVKPLPSANSPGGLIFGENWKELRRQALTVLRDHGMGKIGGEEKIRMETEYLVEKLSSLKGVQSSKTFKNVISAAVSNIINQIVFGHRVEYDDPNMESLQNFESYVLVASKASIIPFYRFLPWDPLELTLVTKYFRGACEFFRSEIEQHKKTLDVDEPRDYIDAFLAEGIKTGNPIFKNEDDLFGTIRQLYIGGHDTSSTTLTWALLYLINNPKHQEIIAEEIRKAVGSRAVSYKDRESMPFTQAFILETLRCSGMAGNTVIHKCTADTVIQGQLIPKDTAILGNLYSTFHDEEVFPDSYSFKPERFLNDDGVLMSKPSGKQMLPFSIGRRVCLGEGLARTELFMFLVSLVQHFEVEGVGDTKSAEQGIDVFTHSPRPYQYIMKSRD